MTTLSGTARRDYFAALFVTVPAAACGLMWLSLPALGQTERGQTAIPSGSVGAQVGGANLLLSVLLALAAVVVLGQVLGRGLARIGQPPVIGEVAAGILLGPSLLGVELSARVLPPAAAPTLGVVAQLGVLLFMFGVGLKLDLSVLRAHARTAAWVSAAGIAVPFSCGAVLALAWHAHLAPPGVAATPFALFCGVAMSVTAFPVLARILEDRGLDQAPLGVLALSCAAADDAAAWCLLALVAGVARSQSGEAIATAVRAAVYLVLMLAVARPLVTRWLERWSARHGASEEDAERGALPWALAALLLSAAASEWAGMHAIFGAFMLGVLVPAHSGLARTFARGVAPLATALLLPAFFAFSGMRTRLDLVAGWEGWLACAVAIAIATAGKFGGVLAAARACGVGWRASAALGALMNTRGLMELIVLNAGLDLGVLSPRLFSVGVVMAVVTTLMTAPLLRVLLPPGSSEGARNLRA